MYVIILKYISTQFHQGKVAIITGSGQGLGKAFANQLLMRGAKVLSFYFCVFLSLFLYSLIAVLYSTFWCINCVKGLSKNCQVCLSDVKTETGLRTLAELKDTYGSQNVHFIR